MMFFTEVGLPGLKYSASSRSRYSPTSPSIELDSVAFEMCFPTATETRAESDSMRAAQESVPEQNAETASLCASAASSKAAQQNRTGIPTNRGNLRGAATAPPAARRIDGRLFRRETAPAPASVADASHRGEYGSAGRRGLPCPASPTREAAPAPAGAQAPVQSGPEAQPKPDKHIGRGPTDPAALTDFPARELTAMPHAHFKNGCLLQDLIKYFFEAVQLDKDAARFQRVELFKSISKGITRAALAGHGALKGHPDDPSGEVRPRYHPLHCRAFCSTSGTVRG